jgi:hypothetical protein
MTLIRIHCAICLLLAALVGCGASSELPLVPVTGTVLLDDKPLGGAMLMFIPTGETRGQGGAARTDASGRFEVKTPDGKFPGAVVGSYQVVINKFVNADGTDFVPNDEIGPMDAGYTEVLPPNYSDLSQTELTATVPEEGRDLEFKLQSQKP